MEAVITEKKFHNGNLVLQLRQDPLMNAYRIVIYRVNSKSHHDLFGIFLTFENAIEKFDSITL